MSSLQPKLKQLQQRYANDRQKISQETMRLYREQGVNPLGCLGPMFIQMPIWIGLYRALLTTLPVSSPSVGVTMQTRLSPASKLLPVMFWLNEAMTELTAHR